MRGGGLLVGSGRPGSPATRLAVTGVDVIAGDPLAQRLCRNRCGVSVAGSKGNASSDLMDRGIYKLDGAIPMPTLVRTGRKQ